MEQSFDYLKYIAHGDCFIDLIDLRPAILGPDITGHSLQDTVDLILYLTGSQSSVIYDDIVPLEGLHDRLGQCFEIRL